jgi:pyruvate-formate lyase-activating enzyme
LSSTPETAAGRLPALVVSDRAGNIFEIPGYLSAGVSGGSPVVPQPQEYIELPYGSNLFMLPDRLPIGFDPRRRRFVTVREHRGEPVFAVAAFMAPAYLQLYRSACRRLPHASRLSLYSYTAVGWRDGRFLVAGMRIDPDRRQDLRHVDLPRIERRARQVLRRFPGNRLARHLVDNCVFRYGCPAARNFVMERWECPVPTSPVCNSRCLGCISRQPGDSGVCASQDRIGFVPSVGEVVELTVPHLEKAPRPVISFGQGCEGEPLMVGDLIEEAIREIRRRTPRGIININTNASRPEVIERLCRAGLDSIRVSVNSAREPYYTRYYRPQGYSFRQVLDSMKIVRGHGGWISINYLIFPGFTDDPREVAALEELIDEVKLNMIQTRNLNIDPDWYIEDLDLAEGLRPAVEPGAPDGEPVPRGAEAPLGIRRWVDHLRHRYPWLKLGYFNPPREDMKEEHFQFMSDGRR